MDSNSKGNEAYSEFRSAMNFAEFVAGLFAKTITVFFRHDFGTRYFSWSNAVSSIFALLACTFVVIGFLTGGSQDETSEFEKYPLIAFLIGFIIISLTHNILAWHYKKERAFWHSRYTGTSHLESLLPDRFRDKLNRDILPFFGVPLRYVVQRFVEPGITVSVGLFTAFVLNTPLGLWLTFSGLSLAAIEWLNATRYNRRITDAMDAQIEAQWIGEAITTTTPDANKTNGFVMPVPSYLKPQERQAIYSGMMQLDPALKAIMDEPQLVPKIPVTPQETINNIVDKEPEAPKEAWEV